MRRVFSILSLIFILLVGACKTNNTGDKPLFRTYGGEDGLHFEVNQREEFVNLVFHVTKVSDGVANMALYGNGEVKDYVYAFVSPDETYDVYAEFYDKDWTWNTKIESDHFTVKAAGGEGDSFITYNGFSYNGDRLLSINNYEIHSPNVKLDWKSAYSCIYYSSSPFKNNDFYSGYEEWDGAEDYDIQKGSFNLKNSMLEKLSQNNYFWYKYVYNISYKNNNYQYEVSSKPVTFTYSKNLKTKTSSDGLLSISATDEGFKIYENFDGNFYKNVRIRVWDCTNNRNCPSIIGNGSQKVFDYPFLEKDCEYYIYVQGWDGNWNNYKESESLIVKAESGSGNYIFTFSSVDYDDKDTDTDVVANIILNDYYNHNPLWNYSDNYYVQGDIAYEDKSSSVWDRYFFENGILSIKNRLSFFRGKKFRLNIQMYFTCKNVEYEYGFLYYDDGYYTDNHQKSSLMLNNDYQEIYDFGEYEIGSKNSGKKAFLITYNKTNKAIGDYTGTYSRSAVSDELDSDCIICDLPVGDIVKSNARAAVNPNPDYSSYKVGVTKKTFDGKEATLVSAHEHCNIWFYNSNKTSTQQLQDKIDKGEFSYQLMGEYFDRYFEMITYVFGSNVPQYQFSNIISVNKDTKIDLFVCDMISAGYGTSAGMYSGRNMYLNCGSNECEMLYIGTYAILTYGYGTFNVALHEFQHLLTDVNKTFSGGRYGYDHDYTEMMSCACENIFQTQYPENIRTFENGMISSRFGGPGFNTGYMAGISNWGCFGNTGYNYGANCAFIDFIMRYYGGVEVIRKIVQSDKTNREAIVDAVNKMGYNETLDSLMMKFALCTVNSGLSVDKAAGGITAVKYTSNEMVINGRNTKFELMPLYYNWYSSSAAPDIYNINDRYEKIFFNTWDNKGPSIIDGRKNYKYMPAKSFNIKYLGQNLNSINIENPGNDYILAVVFRE